MSKTSKVISEVDELGVLLAQIAPLARREKELKDKLKAMGQAVMEGHLFRCTVALSTEDRLDTKGIREDMGETWCAAYTNEITKTTVRCTAKTGALVPG